MNNGETIQRLDWIERAGVSNMQGKHATAQWLAQQAGVTLTVLLAGAGGSLAYATKLMEPGATAAAWGAAWLCGYLAVLGLWLVVGCLLARPIGAVYNEPGNLLSDAAQKYSFDELRRGELQLLQKGIDEAFHRNERVARHLNAIRVCAALSPLVFAVAAGYCVA